VKKLWFSNKNIDIKFSACDAFLQSSSAGTLKVERLFSTFYVRLILFVNVLFFGTCCIWITILFDIVHTLVYLDVG
jgi:hypothetical protein